MKVEKITYVFYLAIALFLSWKVYDILNPDYEKKAKENIYELQDKRAELDETVKLAALEISKKISQTKQWIWMMLMINCERKCRI